MTEAVLSLGDPRLRVRCAPVEDVQDPMFREEARRLEAALLAFRARHGFGRGIAAPQLGIPRRFIALRLGGVTELLVNPEISEFRGGTFTLWDDCMCFPDLLVKVRRHQSLTLHWTDLEGHPHSRDVEDPALAELLQHELDHLDGVLAVDRAEGPAVPRDAFEADAASYLAQVDPYLRLRGPDAFRTSPWRNGGGVTTELAIHPEEASVSEAFEWRVSTAQVASSGPFSCFPGCDRTLLLLEGEGMTLDHGPHGLHALETPGTPHVFSGDWDTLGTLRGGPCRDFNVITRRAAWRHEAFLASGGLQAVPSGGLLLAFALQGDFHAEETGLRLREGSLLESHRNLTFKALAPNCQLLVVRLEPASRCQRSDP